MANGKPMYELDGGMDKIFLVYQDSCILRSKNNFASFVIGTQMNGDKEFFYDNLTSVKYDCNRLLGYVEFEYPGATTRRHGPDSDNAFAFKPKKVDPKTMEKIVSFIKQKMSAVKEPKVVVQSSSADELKKYKELLDMGVITQEEFNAKKKQLLGL